MGLAIPPRRGRFARRMIALFLLTAVLPLLGVGALSFNQLVRNTREQAYTDLHHAAKLTGLVLSDQFDGLERRLTEVAHYLLSETGPALSASPPWGKTLGDAFTAVSRVGGGRRPVSILGPDIPPPALTPEEVGELARGRTVIRHGQENQGKADLLMIRPVDPARPADGMLVGQIRQDRLWALQSVLPAKARLCVLDGDRPMACALPDPGRLAAEVELATTRSDVGRMQFVGDGETYFVSYWSLFLEARFGTRTWVIVVAQPQDQVLSGLVRLGRIYGPAGVAIILVAVLVMLVRLRRRLEPLVALRDAAGRIAQGDFGQRVGIATGDEFEELADDFNRMAERLQRQFNGLSVQAEIDRLILSSFDARHIIDTVLNRTPEIVPCDAVGMLVVERGMPDAARLCVRLSGADAPAPDEVVRLAATETTLLVAHPEGVTLPDAGVDLGFVESLRAYGCRFFRVFPVVHKGRLAGALVLAHRQAAPDGEDDLRELREFADRVAVALSNAAWEEKLYRQAHYDSLTGLPNRALMQDRLERAIIRARRQGSQVALLFVDLDRFKAVNDSLSHAAGDALLKRTAEVLEGCVRDSDTVVRFGGDEFVVLLPDVEPGEEGERSVIDVVDRILERTRHPFDVDGYRINVTATIGIALHPRDADTLDDLLRNADAAMYHAKSHARGGYEFFSPELNAAALERLTLEQELRVALERGQFRVYYQPQVEAVSGRIVGAEALIRWEHPERGLVSPAVFVPLAEETGLIAPIGAWVLETAVAQVTRWCEAGTPLRLGVNVAPQQLARDDFPATVEQVLAASGLDPGSLELEVTEGAIMSNTERNVAMLATLRGLGVRLSVDDFGTGYSSLSYLQRFPLHTLKVDQSFTRNMMENPDSAAIAAAVIALGHSLGLSVIAEGVETEAQRDRLVELGCEELQGYLFGRPMPAEAFAALLEPGRLVPH